MVEAAQPGAVSLPTFADKAAVARALAALERAPRAAATLALLDAAFARPRARTVGLTGPPGVGKSSLLSVLIRALRSAGSSVSVVAVDPSSRRSGGALLGDRIRLMSDPEDRGLFVRSMAARERLGGLADITMPAVVLLRAIYDVVLVETVGVGQSEADVAGVVDSVVFCVQPGSGDALQFMKAGIIEIPHVAVVTKADLGAPAEQALADLTSALALAAPEPGWAVRTLAVSARDGQGLTPLREALADHAAFLARDGRRETLRQRQAEAWLREALRARFGSHGLARAGPLALAPGESPFRRLAALCEALARGAPSRA